MTRARNNVAPWALLLLSVLLFATSPASAQPGSLVGSVTFSVDCSSGLGMGITFDGTNLWYSCWPMATDLYRANPTTGVVNASYAIAGGLGALAYDSVRNVIWAGAGCANSTGTIIKIPLDASKNVSGPAVTAITGVPGSCIDDGIAIDNVPTIQPAGGGGILYYGPDSSTVIYKYDAALGTPLGSFPWTGTGCFNSGLAIGGSLLFQGSDGCSHVWVVNKDTLAPAFDFSTVVAGDLNFRDEGLSCDPTTFFPSLGKQVMWSKEAFSPMRAHAFEIPPGTCGSGGSAGSCELSQGYWKTHPQFWPVTSLTLGGSTYTEAQLLVILGTPPQGDASLILADQLIAALLNIANGSDPSPITAALAAAQSELAAVGLLPAGVRTNTAAGHAMTTTASILDQYNNDLLSPGCTQKLPGKGPAQP